MLSKASFILHKPSTLASLSLSLSLSSIHSQSHQQLEGKKKGGEKNKKREFKYIVEIFDWQAIAIN
jgi:hypothetical protein